MASQIEGAQNFKGAVTLASVNLPSECVEDRHVEAGAGIDSDKLEHQHRVTYGQANTAAVDETRIIHVVHGTTGEVIAFVAGSIAKAVGDATCTVDLKKNGTTVLTGVITLDSGNTNRVAEAGTLSGTVTLAVGDVLEVVIDGTIGTGTLPTGVFCSATIKEDAQ